MDENRFSSSNIIVEARCKITVTGVENVVSFDDETIVLETALGKLTVKGEALHIEGYNTESGDLTANGKLYAAVYTSESKSQSGFLSRIFR